VLGRTSLASALLGEASEGRAVCSRLGLWDRQLGLWDRQPGFWDRQPREAESQKAELGQWELRRVVGALWELRRVVGALSEHTMG